MLVHFNKLTRQFNNTARLPGHNSHDCQIFQQSHKTSEKYQQQQICEFINKLSGKKEQTFKA